ncbi:hypothetical protein ALP97_05241 [Pseudomonas salomonii]|uniref:Uncharacterized protein n=1 Tax=Pseudomonas salomonii TaxID=191391 RepID=A0A3M4QQP3_9PSED|nr:hypothetical protein ALP97_05241 [Pseudomonas salomonii]
MRARHRRVDLEADAERVGCDRLGEHAVFVETDFGTGVIRGENRRQAVLQRRVSHHQRHGQRRADHQQTAGIRHAARGHPDQHQRQADHRPTATGQQQGGGPQARHAQPQPTLPALFGHAEAEGQGQQQGHDPADGIRVHPRRTHARRHRLQAEFEGVEVAVIEQRQHRRNAGARAGAYKHCNRQHQHRQGAQQQGDHQRFAVLVVDQQLGRQKHPRQVQQPAQPVRHATAVGVNGDLADDKREHAEQHQPQQHLVGGAACEARCGRHAGQKAVPQHRAPGQRQDRFADRTANTQVERGVGHKGCHPGEQQQAPEREAQNGHRSGQADHREKRLGR